MGGMADTGTSFSAVIRELRGTSAWRGPGAETRRLCASVQNTEASDEASTKQSTNIALCHTPALTT